MSTTSTELLSPSSLGLAGNPAIDAETLNGDATEQDRGYRLLPRLFKLTAVLGALAIAAWAVAGGIGKVPSLDAVVTAPAVSLCSPIPGEIKSALPRVGSRVTAGTPLVRVHDPRVEDGALASTRAEEATLTGEIMAADAQAKSLRKLIGELSKRRDQLIKLEEVRTASRLADAKADLAAAEANEKQAQQDIQRLRGLQASHSATTRELSIAETSLAVAASSLSSTRANVDRLNAEMVAVQKGMFSGDGSREAADARQRIDELNVRLFELEAESARRAARLKGVRSWIESQVEKLEAKSHAEVRAPVDSVVWSAPVSQGTYANTSDPLITLYDPATRFVLATVRESSAYRIQPGDTATITFLGTGKTVKGRVDSSSGSGSRVDDGTLLARLPDRRDARAHVRITVDEWPSEVAGTSPFDQIGLEVTVSIDGSSWFRRWLDR